MTERPSAATVAALAAGLVLGVAAGVLVGLLRTPARHEDAAPRPVPAAGARP